jgi:Family of unknown function (DUF6064)
MAGRRVVPGECGGTGRAYESERASMGLPFTPEQFFAIFTSYNSQYWLVVAAWYLASIGVVAAAWRNPARYGHVLTYFLAALWAWNAVAYHAVLFTRINPAAWLFAMLFAVEAGLLAWAGARAAPEYFGSSGSRFFIGAGFVVYSLLYPFLSSLGHGYPATPTFGVPCPTTFLTIGLLLTVRGDVPAALAIVPALWAMIGGSAAWLLDVPTDAALLGAGLLLIAIVVAERMRLRVKPPTWSSPRIRS